MVAEKQERQEQTWPQWEPIRPAPFGGPGNRCSIHAVARPALAVLSQVRVPGREKRGICRCRRRALRRLTSSAAASVLGAAGLAPRGASADPLERRSVCLPGACKNRPHLFSRGRFSPARLRRAARIGAPVAFLVATNGKPFVAVAETSSPASEVRAQEERLWADGYITWIYEEPKRSRHAIGYLRAGTSVALRETEPVSRRGCARGWYAVQPVGYVCLDRNVSLSSTRYSRSMATIAPAPGAFPFHYALSYGTPTYRRLPTVDEAARAERRFGPAGVFRPMPSFWRGREQLAIPAPIQPSGPRPKHLDGKGSASEATARELVRRDLPYGSMMAYTAAFAEEGRTWLVSADGTVVPSDRVRAFRPSAFRGVELGPADGSPSLPIGWPRVEAAVFTLRDDPGCRCDDAEPDCGLAESCLVQTSETVPVREPLPVGREKRLVGGTEYWVIEDRTIPRRPASSRETVRLLRTEDVRVAFELDKPPVPIGLGEKWIAFSISRGTLVAYEGERAVFATLASPGKGGVPRSGGDSLGDRTTPTGVFRLQFKHWTDDMSPESGEHRSFWIAEVPFAQYFQQPFAIHVAYWHESFGEPMSGGCINVSPHDGHRLFGFTDPPLPPGWHGVGASASTGQGTVVYVER